MYTFLRRAKAVVPRHVLDVVDERRVGQNGAFAIQPVDGVLEGQLGAAVLLVLAEDATCHPFASRRRTLNGRRKQSSAIPIRKTTKKKTIISNRQNTKGGNDVSPRRVV